MGNIYGVATPIAVPLVTGPGSDVACPAATETNVIANIIAAALTLGSYYPLVSGVLVITMGATPPTALVIAARIGAAADFATYTVSTLFLTANANVAFPFTLIGANSSSAFVGASVTVNVSVNPTAQAVTTRVAGSYSVLQLFRGPDLIP